MVYVNDYLCGSDSESIERAMAARDKDGIVVFAPREAESDPGRNYWLIDRAILLPEKTTVILRNCDIKLSDRCRDNFFRTANCGFGFPDPKPISGVHIKGEGFCRLIGADHPRASGDSSKTLHAVCPFTPEDLCRYADWIPEERRSPEKLGFWDQHDHSYGTDALDPNESHYGDWRGIGVLLANCTEFSVEGIKIVDSHGWGISLEACSYGFIRDIEFDMRMSKTIDGMLSNMENQDGIDIRNGCHHITVSGIRGETGDDMIALTAIVPDKETYTPGGSLRSTHVMHNDWTRRERDIHDIIIRDVVGHSYLCFLLRLLPANTRIYNVVIDGLIDISRPIDHPYGGTLLLGDGGGYGENHPESMSAISISNVVCSSNRAVCVEGYLKDSCISNLINNNPACEAVSVSRENGMENVMLSNIVQRGR